MSGTPSPLLLSFLPILSESVRAVGRAYADFVAMIVVHFLLAVGLRCPHFAPVYCLLKKLS